jgi:hypothetical protein
LLPGRSHADQQGNEDDRRNAAHRLVSVHASHPSMQIAALLARPAALARIVTRGTIP